MRYKVYTYQPAGFSAGWREREADKAPDGAEVVGEWDYKHADTAKVYAVDTQAKGGK